MFFLGDGATGFGGVFWPEFFWEDGVGDEAGLEGDCLHGLEVDRGGGAADVEELEKVAAGGVCERGETQFFPSFIGEFALFAFYGGGAACAGEGADNVVPVHLI